MTLTISSPLTRNSAADELDVVKVKKALNRLGLYMPYEKTGITGMTDTALFEAIAAFQTQNNLPASGEMRPNDATVKAMRHAVESAAEGYYIWRTVEDGHVRPAHALLNRTLRLWSAAPRPGDGYHCRCWAVPVAQEKADQLYADAIEPVYPEAYIIPALRAGRIPAMARALYKLATSEPRWKVNPPKGQLQKKFKHADVFGIKGNQNNANLEKFRQALQKHVDSEDTTIINGTYHKEQVMHYYNSRTGINVMRRKSDGEFISVWKPGDKQLKFLEELGKLGGGKK